MKLLLAIFFLSLSMGIAFFAYVHGQANKKCDCACDETFEAIPNSPVFYFLREYDQVETLPTSYCQVIHFTTPRVPLYVDLYAIAGVCALVSLFVATKSSNNLIV